MKCPNCGYEQPDGLTECQKCQIFFSKWYNREEIKTLVEPQSTQVSSYQVLSTQKDKASSDLFWTLVMIIVFAAGWWILQSHGLPVLEGSYQSDKFSFALRVPPNWITLTKENYSEMNKYLEKFPESLRNIMQRNNTEVGFIKMVEEGRYPPTINLVIMKNRLPEINETSMNELGQLLSTEFSQMFQNYVQESIQLITVDDIKSIRIAQTGSINIKTSDSNPQKFNIKFLQVVIPGKNIGYLLTFGGIAEDFPIYEQTFNHILDTFRVLKRPVGLVTESMLVGFQAGLVFGAGYLVFLVFKLKK